MCLRMVPTASRESSEPPAGGTCPYPPLFRKKLPSASGKGKGAAAPLSPLEGRRQKADKIDLGHPPDVPPDEAVMMDGRLGELGDIFFIDAEGLEA